MNKNTVLGLLLIFGILILYSIYISPSKEEIEAKKRMQDSIALVRQGKINDSIVKNQKKISEIKVKDTTARHISHTPDATKNNDSVNVVLDKSELGVFAGSAEGKNSFYILENELVKVKISKKGGKICSVQLKKYKTSNASPLILSDEDSTKFGIVFFANNKTISTNNLYFSPFWFDNRLKEKDSLSVKGDDSLSFAMRLYPDNSSYKKDKYIEFLYTLKGNSYLLGYKINFVGMQDIMASNTDYLTLEWKSKLLSQEKSLKNELATTNIFYKYYKEDVDNLSSRKDDKDFLKTKIKWISFKQQFFSSVLISDNSFLDAEIETKTDESSDSSLKTMSAKISIPYLQSSDYTVSTRFYFGPNKYKILKKIDLDLERMIPLGWGFFLMAWINRFAVIPVFNFLEGFNINYGIIILILTILLKTVLFPIAYKTYMSSAKMRVLKPEIDVISAKFPKKEDAMKKQQATMALYKKAGVNPMAGCVPMLLQFPILIALFRFFPAAIELRQQGFLWADDLSSYDSVLNLGFNIPFYGDHVSLFTLLMTVSTIFYTKINNQQMGASSTQMPGMKMMMYLMPVMFLGIFNNYASGLSYYYFLANIITFAQMYVIRKFFVDEDKIRSQIQMRKMKPGTTKKSNFQKRLEEMAKQKGYNPKRK